MSPDKHNQGSARKHRGSRGGRPPAHDAEACKGRNVVERLFALAKRWRGIATRYDKLAITDRAGIALCAILTWLRVWRSVTQQKGPGSGSIPHGRQNSGTRTSRSRHRFQ